MFFWNSTLLSNVKLESSQMCSFDARAVIPGKKKGMHLLICGGEPVN